MGAEKQMSYAYRAGYLHREVEVLMEEKKEINGRVYWIGHTPQYIKAAKAVGESSNLSNQIVRGEITEFLKDDIMLLK